MPAIIVYLLKVNAALCLFYLAYRFALRPLTFYYLNRFFLVFGIVFSSVYPLVDISALFARQTAIRQQLTTIVPNWNAVIPVVQHQAATVNYWGVPIALFWIGVVLMSARLAVQFISLYRIHRGSEQQQHFGQAFRAVQSDVNPFSFWQDIYLNPDKHTAAELRSIIQHEQIHVKQWHTLDVILAELSVVFYWFNPGVWFMKQAVKENLEFITDREILRSGVDEKVYQYSLVRVSALKPGAAIVNNFNFLTIKKRIIMMNKKRSSKAQITKYVILLPLVMLLALVFTVSKAELNHKSIALIVKKMLPATVPAQSLPTVQPSAVTLSRDTIKPKLKKDTLQRIAFIQIDENGDHADTLIEKDAKTGKTTKSIRINSYNVSSTDKNPVLILDDQQEPLNLSEIAPDQIQSIRVIDTVRTLNGLSTKQKAVLVRVRPIARTSALATTGTAVSSAVTVSPGTNVSFSPRTAQAYAIDVRDNDDEMVYLIDPQNINTTEIENTRKNFKNNGFDLKVHEDYSGNKLKGLNVSINSEGKSSSASASAAYSNDDMSKVDYLIKIVADKTTGAVSVMAVKR